MPQISLIKYSDIKQARRYDSEYFKPEYLMIENLIKKIKSEPLSFFVQDWYRVVYENTKILSEDDILNKKTVNFLQASDIDWYSLNYDLKKVDYSDWDRYKKWRIKHWEILIEVKWNVEKIWYVPSDFPLNTLVSWSLYKLTVNEKITPELLLIWLTCKYWNYLKSKLKRNLTIHFLWKDDLYNISIPTFTKSLENEVTEIVKSSFKKQTQSKELYKQAEEILLAELWLLNHEINHKKTFSTTKKAVNEAHRFDSEYFQPKYDEIIRKIEKTWYVSLWDSESFSIITWTYSESYWEKWVSYIRSVNINSDLTISPEDMYKTNLDLWNKFKVETWDIITSRVWSIWTLGYVSEEFNNSFISDNILRIRNNNNNLNNLFIAIYLKKIWTIFMERLQRWSVQQRLNQETLKEIKIPLIKPEIQKEIAEKIELSHKLRKESKELLELAKRKVEEEIEKGV